MHATTLAQALDLLALGGLTAALVDLCVPDSEGLPTFQAVHDAAPHLPVLVQSNLEARGLGVEAVARGAQDYLVKGQLDADRLHRALRYALQRHALERELAESKLRLELAMAGARDGLWDWNLADGGFHVSARWREVAGAPSDEEGIDTWLSRVHPADLEALRKQLHLHVDGGSPYVEHEHRLRSPSGEWSWVLARGKAVRDDEGVAHRIAGSMTDINDRKEAASRVLHAALHDALTGLPNRALFIDRLALAMRRSHRSGRVYGVLFMDLDRFKVVNDSLGHRVGDDFLVVVADRLQQAVRPADTVARLGGDEFVILVEDVDQVGELQVVADRLHAVLRQPVDIEGHRLHPSASIGIAEGRRGYTSPEELLRDADTAMYRAKKEGRARSAFFDQELREWALRRLELENGIRLAIAQEELELHYQPVVDVATGRVHGVEALLRWRRGGRLLLPGEFLGHATDAGALTEIGTWALLEACEDIARANEGRSDALRLSVNLASCQLREGDLIRTVDEALESSGLPASNLVLELTETAIIENAEQAAYVLSALRERGVRIHLDDFGAGYSGLAYLQQLPVDCLKIDRSFVSGICEKPGDLAIVRAILGLAEGLGMEVVAEGVETGAQRGALVDLGCPFAQGFLFGRPADLPTTMARAVVAL